MKRVRGGCVGCALFTMDESIPDIPANSNHATSLVNDLPIVHIISFGHRRGPLSPPSDLSIDLRSLPCPPKSIRGGRTGVSKTLRDWLFTNETVQERFQVARGRIHRRLDQAEAEGRTEVVVGVNCELGKHRSVAFVEELGRVRFRGWNVVIGHRDAHLKRSSQKHRAYRDLAMEGA
jgi:RNase adaptor protein for sRNA GlmZ degradation